MFSTARKFLMLAAIVSTTALTACIPDEKDPGKISDAGKINGTFYASSLGNMAVQIQNSLVGDPTWFANTTSTELNLASMGIDTNLNGATVKSHVCPTGTGTQVIQLTWVDGRDTQGKFKVKGTGTDTGQILAALRSRVSSDQVGMYDGSANLQLGSGSGLAIPTTCTGLAIPVGAPVLAFTIDKPAAPVAEMARTEYRTVACPTDIRGIQQRGTQVQSRIVRYTAEGAITPADANTGWSTENLGTCVSDTIVTANSTTNTNAGSVALNNFADLAAQGLKSILEQQLRMDCATTSIASDKVAKVNGVDKRTTTSKNIDTCVKATASAAGRTIKDTTTSNVADSRDVCVEKGYITNNKAFLGVSTGTLTSNLAGTAWVDRLVEKVTLNQNSSQSGERSKWVGRPAIACRANDSYVTNCANVPGKPTGPDVAAAGSKWESNQISHYAKNESWVSSVFNVCFSSCTTATGGTATVLNKDWFNSKETLHNANSTTTAIGGRDAYNWSDAVTNFIPNFQFTAFTVPAATNQCLIRSRELQLACPLTYNSNKEATWEPYQLSPTSNFLVTMNPGGGYGGTSGQIYNRLLSQGEFPASVSINYKKTHWIKKTKRWTETAGPGTNAYIISWRNTQPSSVHGATTSVQTIMMNKNGQIKDSKPGIVSGPALRYVSSYSTPLHCGRIERRSWNWPTINQVRTCSWFKGCSIRTVYSTTTVTEIITREWSGVNATDGTWSRPRVIYQSPFGYWNTFAQIPNPMPAVQQGGQPPLTPAPKPVTCSVVSTDSNGEDVLGPEGCLPSSDDVDDFEHANQYVDNTPVPCTSVDDSGNTLPIGCVPSESIDID